MSDIKLYTKTTVELELFEKFTEFIIGSREKQEALKIDFYVELKAILGFKKKASTLENEISFSRANDPYLFKLPKECYEAFCMQFREAFDNMALPDKEKYSAINSAFLSWRSTIDQRHQIVRNDKSVDKENPISKAGEVYNEYPTLRENYPIIYTSEYPPKNPNYHSFFNKIEKSQIGSLQIRTVEFNNDIQPVYEFIKLFYHTIGNEEFKEAWDNLSDIGKSNSWGRGEYHKFKDYCRCIKHYSAKTFEIVQQEKDIFECLVYHKSTSNCLSSELDIARTLSLNELDRFVELISNFKGRLDDLGVYDFDQIPIDFVFRIDATNEIFVHGAVPGEHKRKGIIFPPDHFPVMEKEIGLFWMFHCRRNRGDWKIDNIRLLRLEFKDYDDRSYRRFSGPPSSMNH